MGKLAQVVQHYEAALKTQGEQLSASRVANAHLQATQTQSAPDMLDAADKAAFASAQARFTDLLPLSEKTDTSEATATETGTVNDATVGDASPSAASSPPKFVAPPDPK